MLRFPDDGLELIVDRLPDHALQPFDPGHTDPDVSNNRGEQRPRRRHASRASPGSGLWFFVSGVAHGAELGHEEVVAPVVGGRVLLDVGKLHKLEEDEMFQTAFNRCTRSFLATSSAHNSIHVNAKSSRHATC